MAIFPINQSWFFSVQIVNCSFGLSSYLTVCLNCKDQQWQGFIVTFNTWNIISTFETFLFSSLSLCYPLHLCQFAINYRSENLEDKIKHRINYCWDLRSSVTQRRLIFRCRLLGSNFHFHLQVSSSPRTTVTEYQSTLRKFTQQKRLNLHF